MFLIIEIYNPYITYFLFIIKGQYQIVGNELLVDYHALFSRNELLVVAHFPNICCYIVSEK